MLIKNRLEDIGIEALYKIEENNKIELAKQVLARIANEFNRMDLDYTEMYKKLLNTDMYYAKIQKDLSSVNYDYKTSTMYFSEDTDFHNINEYTFHECIHRLQEKRDKHENIVGYGLCEVNELTVKGSALNEGAIQYIATKALNMPEKIVTIYGIKINSKTDYYPMLTNIVSQIAHLLGDDILIDSVLNTNENFKIQIIDNLGERNYFQIEKNCNDLLKVKDDIFNMQKLGNQIEYKDELIKSEIEEIKNLYFQTQNTIYRTYFEDYLKRTENELEVLLLKEKLNSYSKLAGRSTYYDDFNEFYIYFNKKADDKIEEFRDKKALIVIKNNIFFRIIKRINQFLRGQKVGDR